MEENSSTFVADDLNEDCLLEIFSYLSINDMMQVKNVCRKWRQVSQQWFKQVQTVKFKIRLNEIWKWKLYAKYFKRELGSGTEIKKLIPILKLFGHHIKYFSIYYSTKVQIPDDEKLICQLIPRHCENVVDAEIINVDTRLYPTLDVDVMAKHWKQLEKFSLIECFSESLEKNMYELLRNNQQLKILTLSYCHHRGPQSDIFFTYLPRKIEKLHIDTKFSGPSELIYFISTSENFTSLSSLKFEYVKRLSDAAGAAIGNLRSLKHLALCDIKNYESRSTINPIANLDNLKSLILYNNENLDENMLINIVNSCKQLEQLMIFSKILTDKGMTAISELKKLKILNIDADFVSTNSIINLCDNLEGFICRNSNMNNNDAIKLLKKATNLWYVDFSDCSLLTEDLIEAANEIANERKRNILHMFLTGKSIGIYEKEEYDDTPYFKSVWADICSFSFKLLPNYITDYLKENDFA